MTTIADSIATYITHRSLAAQLGRISENTLRATDRDLRGILKDLLDLDIEAVCATLINDALARKQQAGASYNSLMRYTSSLSGWLKSLDKTSIVDGLYTRQGRAPRRVEKRALTQDETTRILASTTGRNHLILTLLLDTGMRVGELVSLTWGDLDLAAGTLLLRNTKNRQDRLVKVSPEVLDRLIEGGIGADDEHIFLSRTGRQLGTRDVQNICSKAGGAAGVKFSPHALRHTFATRAHHAHVPLAVIRDQLGHSSIAVTDTYLHSAA